MSEIKTKFVTPKPLRSDYMFAKDGREVTDDDDNVVEGVKNYSCRMIIPKKSPFGKSLKKNVDALLKEKFPGVSRSKLKNPLRDGDEEQDEKGNEHLAGMYFMNANSRVGQGKGRKPGLTCIEANKIVQRCRKKGRKPDEEEQEEINDAMDIALEEGFYSGAHYNISFNLYPFDRKGNRGIACGLSNVMFVKDGDRLDGSTSAADDFADCETDDDEDDDDWDE